MPLVGQGRFNRCVWSDVELVRRITQPGARMNASFCPMVLSACGETDEIGSRLRDFPVWSDNNRGSLYSARPEFDLPRNRHVPRFFRRQPGGGSGCEP